MVKVGGKVLETNAHGVTDSVASFVRRNGRVVLVHGGGVEVDRTMARMGIQPRYVVSPSGVRSRYTDKEELEVVIMVLAGLVNKALVHALQARGVRALGLTGVDGAVVRGVRRDRIVVVDERGRKRLVDAGFTGRIESVDAGLLRSLSDIFEVLVISPLIFWEGSPLNTDGDYFASRLACELRAEALVFLTDVDGVLVDGSLVRRMSAKEARELSAKVGFGMNRKLVHAAEAAECGVPRVVIANGLLNDPVSSALSGEGSVVEP